MRRYVRLERMSVPSPETPPAQVPYPLRLAASYLWRLGLVAAAVYGLLHLLHYFTSLVVPFLIATLLTALLHPLVVRLSRYMPRVVAVLITVLFVLALLAGLFTLVGTQISNQLAQLTDQAIDGFAQMQNWIANGPLHVGSSQVSVYLREVSNTLSANSSEIAKRAWTFTAGAGEVLTGLALSVFSLVFLLLDGRQIWLWMVRFLPRSGRAATDAAGRASWHSLTAYVRATVMVAATDALGIGIGAAILGVPLAIPLGVLVFIGAFVPIVGALVSGAVAVLVALLTLGFIKALIMLAIVIGVQQLESHVLQPFLMGRMVEVHPLGVVFAIGAGIIVDGIVGALFAVPLVAVLNTFTHALAAPDTELAAEELAAAADPLDGTDVRESDVVEPDHDGQGSTARP